MLYGIVFFGYPNVRSAAILVGLFFVNVFGLFACTSQGMSVNHAVSHGL